MLQSCAGKHDRILLVGVGMGARVAAHMLSSVPGDDGKSLQSLPSAAAKAKVVAVCAIAYPLLRVGSRELRDKPLRAQEKQAPWLFVNGSKDKHMDNKKLQAVRKAMKCNSTVMDVDGGSENPDDKVLAAVVAQVGKLC